MKVTALVSGGKDSCYSIHLCKQHGHEIIALANLLPAAKNVDELDSYMYQTVGHQLVEAYAACMDLPLYRKCIKGTAKQQELAYHPTEGDEVEDLFTLLSFIKEKHPDLQAVASGAIASDYQRTRVENVCSRLGLVSLAYLWSQPQSHLLQCMIDAGIHAILVKVAAMGLEPHKHLGKSLQQIYPIVHKLRSLYGCNVCGEGGEYETLTLDCPAFTHGRIVLDSWEVVLHSPDAVATVGVLHPTAFHIEPKTAEGTAGTAHVVDIPLDWTPASCHSTATPSGPPTSSDNTMHVEVTTSVSSGSVNIRCSTSSNLDVGSQAVRDAATTETAVHRALEALGDEMRRLGLSWQHAVFVHLYLSSMDHFASANKAYCQHFPSINPPSRACVQLQLPARCLVKVDVLVAKEVTDRGLHQRRVLHVQSISDWAPSCIGPYSQLTAHGGLLHMAGQIPLDPGSMNLVAGGLTAEACRCLQSCEAVAIAMNGSVISSSIAAAVFLSGDQPFIPAVEQVHKCVDTFRRAELPGAGTTGPALDPEEDDSRSIDEDTEEREGFVTGLVRPGDIAANTGSYVDPYLEPPSVPESSSPPWLYIQVPLLPRGSAVEIQVVALDVREVKAWVDQQDSSNDEGSEAAEGVQMGNGATTGVRWSHICSQTEQDLPDCGCRSTTHTMQSCGALLRSLISFVPQAGVPPPTAATLSQTILQTCTQALAAHQQTWSDVVFCRVWLAESEPGTTAQHDVELNSASKIDSDDLQSELQKAQQGTGSVLPLVVPAMNVAVESSSRPFEPCLAACEVISARWLH